MLEREAHGVAVKGLYARAGSGSHRPLASSTPLMGGQTKPAEVGLVRRVRDVAQVGDDVGCGPSYTAETGAWNITPRRSLTVQTVASALPLQLSARQGAVFSVPSDCSSHLTRPSWTSCRTARPASVTPLRKRVERFGVVGEGVVVGAALLGRGTRATAGGAARGGAAGGRGDGEQDGDKQDGGEKRRGEPRRGERNGRELAPDRLTALAPALATPHGAPSLRADTRTIPAAVGRFTR